MAEVDLNALAGWLRDTAEHLQQHIDGRAQQIAEPLIYAAGIEAERRILELRTEAAAWEERFNGVRAELQRQLNAQVRQVERLNSENKSLRATVKRVTAALVVCHTDADGNRHAPYDALRVALQGEAEGPS